MKALTRREAMKGIVAGGAGLALAGSNVSDAKGEEAIVNSNEQGGDTSQTARAFRGQHQLDSGQFSDRPASRERYQQWRHP